MLQCAYQFLLLKIDVNFFELINNMIFKLVLSINIVLNSDCLKPYLILDF